MNQHSSHKQHFKNSLFMAGLLVFIPIMVFLFESIIRTKFAFLGVFPRNFSYLYGIITHVVEHADIGHLFNNIISLFILSLSLFYFYAKIADKVLLISWLMMGSLLWIIGRDSIHMGASGLIYALAFFLFWSGVIRKHAPLIAIAFIVVFMYGNMVWHVFPWQAFPNESWEGHLSGAISGTTLALIYRKEGPQRPVKNWNAEPETVEDKDLAEYAESFELEGELLTEPKEPKIDEVKDSNGYSSSKYY